MDLKKNLLFFALGLMTYTSSSLQAMQDQKRISSPKEKRHLLRLKKNYFTVQNNLHYTTNRNESTENGSFIKPVYLGAIKEYTLFNRTTDAGLTQQNLYVITTKNELISLATQYHRMSSSNPTVMRVWYSIPKGIDQDLKQKLDLLTFIDAEHAQARCLKKVDLDTGEKEFIEFKKLINTDRVNS